MLPTFGAQGDETPYDGGATAAWAFLLTTPPNCVAAQGVLSAGNALKCYLVFVLG